MSIDRLEQVINEISDKDWAWWPFLWLRPERHVYLRLRRILPMAVLYGIPCGGLMSLVCALAEPRALAALPFVALTSSLVLLFAGTVLVGPMWNRRADRLKARAPRRVDANTRIG